MVRLNNIMVMLGASACVSAFAVPAYAQPHIRTYSIPASNLQTALDTYARQSGRQIIYKVEEIGSARSKGARGAFSADAALARVLSGTPFSVRVDNSGAIAVVAAGEEKGEAGAGRAPAIDERADVDEAPGEDIVVTASRVNRAGFDAPTPTTVVGPAELRLGARSNVGAVLNDLPQFRATLNPGNTAVSTVNSGVASADLRGIGATRTLVLLNGHRFVGDNDLNTVPFDLVERVEVVTGGASAAWGSGAVAGVVNVILNNKFEGVRLSAQTGISSRGDGPEFRASAALGVRFANGRGRLLLDAEYYDSEGITPRTSRRNIGGWAVLANPGYTPTNGQHAFVIAPNVGPTNLSLGGLITTGVLAGQSFNLDGTLSPFNYGTLRGASLASGGDGPSNDSIQPLTVPVRRYNLFGRITYELTNKLNLSADIRYTKLFNHYLFAPDRNLGDITISSDNAFLAPAIRDRLTAAGQATFRLGRLNNDYAFRDFDFSRRDLQATIGLDGVFGKGWRWDAYYSHGQRVIEQQINNARVVSNFNRAVDSIISPTTGRAICRVALSTPSTDCVPINLFGFGAPSAEAIGYVNGSAFLETAQKLDVGGVSLRGEPVTLWAGPVSIATGAEMRRETIGTRRVDPISQRNGFTTVNLSGQDGGFSVKEAFGEVVIPLLKEVPLFQLLEFNGGVRVSDYSNSGTIWSWKLGVTNRIAEGLRVRAVLSRDTRSANLTELFTLQTNNFATINDPIAGSQYMVSTLNGGNANLKPEVSNTFTIGAVYSPPWTPGLSLSVDRYDIDIDGAISTLAGQDIVTRCANGTNVALCPLITRGTGNLITSIQTTFINLANYRTKGYDIEASYTLPLERISAAASGNLRIRALANHVESLVSTDGVTRVQSAGVVGTGVSFGVPKWNGVAGITYQRDASSFDLRVRYVGGGTFNPAIDIANSKVSSRTYVDLSFETGVAIAGKTGFTLFGAVNNLFDRRPPPAGNPQFYDIIGRYFVIGARTQF